MILLRTGMRLARRRAVTGIALFAAMFCGLGSCIMQELAHSQRVNYDDQVSFAERAARGCRASQPEDERSCENARGVPDAGGLRLYAGETDTLGARARALQTVGGSVHWAQAWLVTLLGLAALLVAVAVTTAADVDARRLVSGWHPARGSRRPLLVSGVAGLSAATVVALGAAGGSGVAALVGGRVWPLGSEPRQVALPGLGPVALLHPSAGWLVAWISVVGAAILISWFIGRTLVAILTGSVLFAGLALLSEALPAWVPWASLPSTTGMWFHHRGEVTHVWRWPVTPLDAGMPSADWAAISATDPVRAARIGAAAALVVLLAAVPWAARRRLT
jgi:hypothetical protein